MTGPGPAKPGSTPQARSTPGPSTPDEIDLSGPSHWATGALLGPIEGLPNLFREYWPLAQANSFSPPSR